MTKKQERDYRGVYFWLYGITYWAPIQQKLTPPVLHFSDFAGWNIKYFHICLLSRWELMSSVKVTPKKRLQKLHKGVLLIRKSHRFLTPPKVSSFHNKRNITKNLSFCNIDLSHKFYSRKCCFIFISLLIRHFAWARLQTVLRLECFLIVYFSSETILFNINPLTVEPLFKKWAFHRSVYLLSLEFN